MVLASLVYLAAAFTRGIFAEGSFTRGACIEGSFTEEAFMAGVFTEAALTEAADTVEAPSGNDTPPHHEQKTASAVS
jgi:hypothetical protein